MENSTAGPEPSFSLQSVRSGVSLLTVMLWWQDRAVKQARPGNNSTLPQEPPCSQLKASIQQGRDVTLKKRKKKRRKGGKSFS